MNRQARQDDQQWMKRQIPAHHRPNTATAITRASKIHRAPGQRSVAGVERRGSTKIPHEDRSGAAKQRWGLSNDVELLWDENRREFERQLQGLRHRLRASPPPPSEIAADAEAASDSRPMTPLSSSRSSSVPSSDLGATEHEFAGGEEGMASQGAGLETGANYEESELARSGNSSSAVHDQQEQRHRATAVRFEEGLSEGFRPRTAPATASGAPAAPRRSVKPCARVVSWISVCWLMCPRAKLFAVEM